MSRRGACLALLALPFCGALQAQAIKNEPPARHFTEAEVAAVEMPALAFEATPEDAANYDKYFYFHRPDTGFDEAFADITECDALSSGSSYYVGGSSGAIQGLQQYYVTQYGMAGAVGGALGGAIGSALADAIHGSAARREQRRLNMRTCMHFKGYDRFGLSKTLWQNFNFEEGNGRKEEDVRERALLMQARVASAQRPQQTVLQP